MSEANEKYTGTAMDRRYTSEEVDVTWSKTRCIHAAECVNRLQAVFDTAKKPWIQPGNSTADRVAEVVERCPSGALHHIRKDGGTAESTPQENTAEVWPNGPTAFRGDLSIQGATVDLPDETRATLCRCGASEHKPFCDNSHQKIEFTAEEHATADIPTLAETGGKLELKPLPNGPLMVYGPLQLRKQDGTPLYAGTKTALCRCGASSNKPFCDGTHNKIGFEAQ